MFAPQNEVLTMYLFSSKARETKLGLKRCQIVGTVVACARPALYIFWVTVHISWLDLVTRYSIFLYNFCRSASYDADYMIII